MAGLRQKKDYLSGFLETDDFLSNINLIYLITREITPNTIIKIAAFHGVIKDKK